MSLLSQIAAPADVQALTADELEPLATEIRDFLVENVSRTGGHLGPNLGVVELTIALHRVFDSPRDVLLWDTGHQAYVHKLVTGRRADFATLRAEGGLSGYPSRAESEHDWIENSHASTVLSYAHGLAVAQESERGEGRRVIAVIGDGSMSAGMAYEAMNNAGAMNSRLIVILNDNDMSIAPPVGAMSAYLSRLWSGRTYRSLREIGKQLASHLPKLIQDRAGRAEEYARGMMMGGGTLFEENVHLATGHVNKTTIAEIETLIRESGFTPAQRTTLYDHVRVW